MIVPPHLAATLNNSGGGSGGNNNNSGNSSANSGLSGAGGAVVSLGSHLGGATTGANTSLPVSGSQDSLSGIALSGGGGGGGNGNGSGSSGSGSSRTGSSNGSGHRILAVNRNIDDLLFGSDLDSLINDNIINGFKSLKVAKSHSQDNLDYHHRHQHQQHPHHQQPFYHHYYSHQLHSLPATQQPQQAPTSLHYQTQHHHLQQQQSQQQVNHWIESDIITNSKMLTDKAKQKCPNTTGDHSRMKCFLCADPITPSSPGAYVSCSV